MIFLKNKITLSNFLEEEITDRETLKILIYKYLAIILYPTLTN